MRTTVARTSEPPVRQDTVKTRIRAEGERVVAVVGDAGISSNRTVIAPPGMMAGVRDTEEEAAAVVAMSVGEMTAGETTVGVMTEGEIGGID